MATTGTGKGCVYRAASNGASAGIWFMKYLVPDEQTGEMEWKTESSGSTEKREALKLLRTRQTDVDAGKPVAQTAGRKNAYTFEAATRAIVGEYRRQNGDAAAGILAKSIAKHLALAFGGTRMTDITHDKIAAYADARLKSGAANATVQKEIRNLSRMFTLGIKAARISWKPAMPSVKVENARQGFFDRADFDAVAKRMPEHYRDLLTLGWWTGWRMASELAPLEWRHIERDVCEIRIPGAMTKNGVGRVFPYGALPEVVAAIERLAVRRETFRDKGVIVAALFLEDDGSPIAARYKSLATPQLRKPFRAAWIAACKAAGVSARLPHDLRRTAVRNLINAGVSEKVSMTITGHKTRIVFDRYHIVNTADLNDAVGKLAARQSRVRRSSAA